MEKYGIISPGITPEEEVLDSCITAKTAEDILDRLENTVAKRAADVAERSLTSKVITGKE